MKKLLTICLVLGLMLAASDFAQGSFVYAPEDYMPDWEGTSPYQRNVLLDFSENPIGDVGRIPGAIYTGDDDSDLWDSDFVTSSVWDGLDPRPSWFEWFATDPSGRTGLFGVDYAAHGGTDGHTDVMTIHLDNWNREWPIKRIWVEFVSTGPMMYGVRAPAGYDRGDLIFGGQEYLGDGFFRTAFGFPFEPNPPFEVIEFGFWGPDSTHTGLYGDEVSLIDSIHIATECIPEPATVALLGLGGLFLRRKRRA